MDAMRNSFRRAALGLAGLLPLIAGSSLACPLPEGALQQGAVQIAWKVVPAPIVVGRHFAVELQVCPADAVLTRVDATMPEHQHGMNYRPSVKPAPGKPAGLWQAEGLLFHMPGRWQLRFDIKTAAGTSTLLTDTWVP